jgi:VWFA-related protein
MKVRNEISRYASLEAFLIAALTLGFFLFPSSGRSNDQEAATPEVTSTETPEITSSESSPSFKVQVERNLVLVRVVIRDANGRPIGGLQKENFSLTDNGRAQTLSHFAVEIPAEVAVRSTPALAEEAEPEAGPETKLAPTTPERYLALFFDDIHMRFEDIARTRMAAEHYLATMLQPGDRVGIFTASGEHNLDFTDDIGKLREDLGSLRPRTIVPSRLAVCPAISDYQAYLMVHQREPFAIAIATQEAYQCNYESLPSVVPIEMAMALSRNLAESEAVTVLSNYQTETHMALRSLENLVRRMAISPGTRSIVLLSPGFLMLTAEAEVQAVVDRALRSNVIINSLDAQGLFVYIPFGEASENPRVVPHRADLAGRKEQFAVDRSNYARRVLAELAHDTGGEFFHNNNDLDAGFQKVGSLPEVYYVLGFSPQNMKYDGRFHTIKIALDTPQRYTIQARSGYYAPKNPPDPIARAKEEIEQAIFSHDEVNELPVAVHLQFFKVNDLDTKLSILAHLDLRFVRFRKENGRNINNLTFVTALFDRDGKYITGREKSLRFRLLDGSLEKLTQSGITAKMTFDVRPGTYLVRQVVRDSEGAQISALNRTVEIPL